MVKGRERTSRGRYHRSFLLLLLPSKQSVFGKGTGRFAVEGFSAIQYIATEKHVGKPCHEHDRLVVGN